MEKRYKLVFDEVIGKQLTKASKNQAIKEILRKMFDKLEEDGPDIGNLLDSRLYLYELKTKRPPIRLYYKHNLQTNEIYVFEFEMKTSEDKQQKTIHKLRFKSQDLF
ncbi:hypothetical protein HYU19_05905 [Candidatus Woesearchaeota archaeon]|nr:hypothetical protein [Candidatus Woesearchaeota archaeon]